jgi:hypothetical protein
MIPLSLSISVFLSNYAIRASNKEILPLNSTYPAQQYSNPLFFTTSFTVSTFSKSAIHASINEILPHNLTYLAQQYSNPLFFTTLFTVSTEDTMAVMTADKRPVFPADRIVSKIFKRSSSTIKLL